VKTYGGVEILEPHILNLGTRWRWVVSFTPWPLYSLGKSPRYPLGRRLCGQQSPCSRVAKRKISAPLDNRIPVVHPV